MIKIKLTYYGMMLKLTCVRDYWMPEERDLRRLYYEHDSTLHQAYLHELPSVIPVDCTAVHCEAIHSKLAFINT